MLRKTKEREIHFHTTKLTNKRNTNQCHTGTSLLEFSLIPIYHTNVRHDMNIVEEALYFNIYSSRFISVLYRNHSK